MGGNSSPFYDYGKNFIFDFKPEKQFFRLTPDWIVLIGTFLTIAFIYLLKDSFPGSNVFFEYWTFTFVLIAIGFIVSSYFRFEPLNGNISGEILFNDDGISTETDLFLFRDITRLEFGFVDFYGERSKIYGFGPKISQGVSNFVSFFDSKNQPQKIYFRLLSRNHYKIFYPFINHAVKVGAMTYYAAIDLIDAENVTTPGN